MRRLSGNSNRLAINGSRPRSGYRDEGLTITAWEGEALKSNILFVALAGLLFLGGCRGLYEGFKLQKAEDCYRLPYPDQEGCLQQVDVSYEQYEKERKAKPRVQ